MQGIEVLGALQQRTVCSDQVNRSLHGLDDMVEVKAYAGENPFLALLSRSERGEDQGEGRFRLHTYV